MILNSTRIMRRWLEHPEHGVIAQLNTPGFPLQRPDGEVDELPPEPAIYDDVDNAKELKNFPNTAPPKEPALIVWADSDSMTDADHRNYQVTEHPLMIAVAFVTSKTPQEVAVLWGGYTARAVRRCLRAFNSQKFSEGYRELNGVKVMKVGRVTEQPVATTVGQSRVWGFVLAEIVVVDRMIEPPST